MSNYGYRYSKLHTLLWNKSFEKLPDRGWDWVFGKGINDKLNKIKANTLNGLQIAVSKKHQGKGISSLVLKEMISLAMIMVLNM